MKDGKFTVVYLYTEPVGEPGNYHIKYLAECNCDGIDFAPKVVVVTRDEWETQGGER